jgi:hypothetical protein
MGGEIMKVNPIMIRILAMDKKKEFNRMKIEEIQESYRYPSNATDLGRRFHG